MKLVSKVRAKDPRLDVWAILEGKAEEMVEQELKRACHDDSKLSLVELAENCLYQGFLLALGELRDLIAAFETEHEGVGTMPPKWKRQG